MPAKEPPELGEGQVLLDRYSIIDCIDSGGMATIYRARDERLDRVVCVKLLRNLVQDAEGSGDGVIFQATYSHFLQEARALSKLSHPNTLRIYDFGYVEIEGDETALGPRPFHVSELLDGGNVAQYVRARGRLEPAEMLAIVARVASAVSEAHGTGIVHRDIKPSNILFARAGDALMPKLADFGIAGQLQRYARGPDVSDSLEVRDAIPLCSPRWAAPEQLVGKQEGVTTDVYALALVAAYMLSGRGLFEGPNALSTVDARVKDDTFAQGRLALCAFPSDVTRVLMGGLRTDPRARTRSPSELYEQLARAFDSAGAARHGGAQHSGQVPVLSPPRPKLDSITLEIPASGSAGALTAEPSEQRVAVVGRDARIVETHERLDLSLTTPAGTSVRFRVTFLPGAGSQFGVNLKGLNCFVARPGSTPSPALVVTAGIDGHAELMSVRREALGEVAWTFGTLREDARVFWTQDAELVVPFPRGMYALALDLGADRDLIVVCRHT